MTADGLLCRDLGDGPPIVVLHGGPDFDHTYLLPELDRLAESFRLLFYDQRGRGRSATGVRPDDVSLASELDDVDRIRSRSGLESTAVLGTRWEAQDQLRDPVGSGGSRTPLREVARERPAVDVLGAARRTRRRPGRAVRADRRCSPGSALLGAAGLRALHLPRGAGARRDAVAAFCGAA